MVMMHGLKSRCGFGAVQGLGFVLFVKFVSWQLSWHSDLSCSLFHFNSPCPQA